MVKKREKRLKREICEKREIIIRRKNGKEMGGEVIMVWRRRYKKESVWRG